MRKILLFMVFTIVFMMGGEASATSSNQYPPPRACKVVPWKCVSTAKIVFPHTTFPPPRAILPPRRGIPIPHPPLR